MNRAPWLPAEPYVSQTIATVSSAKVFYVEDQKDPRFGDSQRNKPQVMPGGDSIVFLRSNRTNQTEDPFWVEDPTSTQGFKYVQGTIGRPPSYPIIQEIWLGSGSNDQVVHTLNGVTSLQRTFRVNPADQESNLQNPRQAIYYLIADAGGVYEFRYDPTQRVEPPTVANPFPRDHGPRLAWAFTNDDYNWVTGGGTGDPTTVRSGETGRYTGGQTMTAASARLLTNGQALITSRTAGNLPPTAGTLALGGEVYALRITDFRRQPVNGSPWTPDDWVQRRQSGGLQRLPSITWRIPAAVNPAGPPLPMPGSNFNPLDLGNTYMPDQPAYADLVF
jgi:hypothetical protein